MEIKQSTRIQTSLLNGVEKKALVWMASRMPQLVRRFAGRYVSPCAQHPAAALRLLP